MRATIRLAIGLLLAAGIGVGLSACDSDSDRPVAFSTASTSSSGSTGSGSTGGGQTTVPGGPGTGTPGNPTAATGTIVATDFSADAVVLADANQQQTTGRVQTPQGPVDVTDNPTLGDLAYVANLRSQELNIVDLKAQTSQSVSLKTAPIVGGMLGSIIDPMLRPLFKPSGIAVTPNGRYAYVPGLISTVVVDLQTQQPVAGVMNIGLPNLSGGQTGLTQLLQSTFKGFGAFRAACSPSHAYVTNAISGNVSVIDHSSHDITDTVPVGRFPVGVAYDSTQDQIFVSCLMETDLYVIDASTNSVVTTVPMVGAGPVDIAYDETKNQVYVANMLSGDVAVVDPVTLTVTNRVAAQNMGSILNKLGLGSNGQLQNMFNQIINNLGLGGSSPGSLGSLLGNLGGQALTTMLQNMLQQFTGAAGLGGNGGIPLAGLITIDVSPNGNHVAVVNMVLGDISLIDPTTGNVTLIQQAVGPGPGAIKFFK